MECLAVFRGQPVSGFLSVFRQDGFPGIGAMPDHADGAGRPERQGDDPVLWGSHASPG